MKLSIYVYISISIPIPSINLSISITIYLCIYTYIYLSIYTSISMSLYLYLYIIFFLDKIQIVNHFVEAGLETASMCMDTLNIFNARRLLFIGYSGLLLADLYHFFYLNNNFKVIALLSRPFFIILFLVCKKRKRTFGDVAISIHRNKEKRRNVRVT